MLPPFRLSYFSKLGTLFYNSLINKEKIFKVDFDIKIHNLLINHTISFLSLFHKINTKFSPYLLIYLIICDFLNNILNISKI